MKAKHGPNPTQLLNFDEVPEGSTLFQIPNFENCENINFEVEESQQRTPKSSRRRLLNLTSTAKVHKHKVNRRNFPNSTSQQFDKSSHSSGQVQLTQIDGEEDDINDSNIDIEEIMQQIIAYKTLILSKFQIPFRHYDAF